MSLPASARVVNLDTVDSSNVGEKIRTYGFLKLPEDASSTIAFLASHRRKKGGWNRGLLVDISICLDPLGSEPFVFREERSLVMVMGSLEELQANECPNITQEISEKRLEIDSSIILRAILLKEANDVNLASLEKIVDMRGKFELETL